ncbi:outer dynein arm-docking complex subunit 3-like [Leptodactylus fuscus]|uniref:outer dynein arm-docking complex subunit 3-like n=1 Tax=Leptodactylus fuscus TaxID=238119 RepID=UPI003F4EE9E9
MLSTGISRMDYPSATSTKNIRTCKEWGRMVNSNLRSRADGKSAMSKTPSLFETKSSIQDQMSALKQKIKILEYDHNVYQESTSHTIKENQETIKLLQQENKKLSKELVQEKQRQADREAKCAQVVLQLKESKLHENIKHHNALSHQAQVRVKRLEELESLLQQYATFSQNNKTNTDENTQYLLENKLAETRLKLQDIEHINSVYSKITNHIQEEMPTFQPQIQQTEAEILLFKNEIKDLKTKKQNVIMSRNKALAEYQHLKKEYRSKRSNTHQNLRHLTYQAIERRHYQKKQAKSVVKIEHSTIYSYEISLPQEEEERIYTIEDELDVMKEVICTTNKCEVLQSFTNQVETRKNLEKKKLQAETTLSELKDKLEKVDKVLQEQKYSKQSKVEAQLSKELKALEELRTQLQLESQNKDKCKMEKEKTAKALDKAISEVKRLDKRLENIKLPENFSNLPLDPQVLDLLDSLGQKMQSLQKHLKEQDIEEIYREMEEEEILDIVELNLPSTNLRTKLPSEEQEKSDTEDSGEDCEVLTTESEKWVSK